MNIVGYYGKLPQRGDFIRFNLPQGFVTVWDDWLQQLLVEAEAQHGNRWATLYGSGGPHWFALSQGIAGDSAWCGVLSPSVDKVGRRFPFCIAAALPDSVTAATAFVHYPEALASLATLAAELQSSTRKIDSAQEALSDIAARFADTADETALHTMGVTSDSRPPGDATNTNGNTMNLQLSVTAEGGWHNPATAAALLDQAMIATQFQYSTWCSASAVPHQSLTHTTCSLCRGLPTGEAGQALLRGSEQQVGSTIVPKTVVMATVTADDTQPVPDKVIGNVTPSAKDRPNDDQDDAELTQRRQGADAVVGQNARGDDEPDPMLGDPDSTSEADRLSTGDWSALDAFEVTAPPVSDSLPTGADASPMPPPTPEPLELDDDPLVDTPWDDPK